MDWSLALCTSEQSSALLLGGGLTTHVANASSER
jgi:hypothetical protein